MTSRLEPVVLQDETLQSTNTTNNSTVIVLWHRRKDFLLKKKFKTEALNLITIHVSISAISFASAFHFVKNSGFSLGNEA